MAKGKNPTTAHEAAIILARQERVARLIIRGLTQREIVAALSNSEGGYRNPDTGEAWSLATINRDVKAIKERWRKEVSQSGEKHRAELFKELAEIRRMLWRELAKGESLNIGAVNSLLKAIREVGELVGAKEELGDDERPFIIRHEYTGDQAAVSVPPPTRNHPASREV